MDILKVRVGLYEGGLRILLSVRDSARLDITDEKQLVILTMFVVGYVVEQDVVLNDAEVSVVASGDVVVGNYMVI